MGAGRTESSYNFRDPGGLLGGNFPLQITFKEREAYESKE